MPTEFECSLPSILGKERRTSTRSHIDRPKYQTTPVFTASSVAKPAEHNASAAGGNVVLASEADDSEEEEIENNEKYVVAADTPVEGGQEAAAEAAKAAAAAAVAKEGEDSFHDTVEEAAESDNAAPTAAAATKNEEEDDDDAEKAEVAELAALASVTEAISGPEAVRRKRAETGDNLKKDKYNAKMQWVITNKMKKILAEELHYEMEEVEAMMPDVAAVVINKHLERPKRGMPPEWRRDFHLRQRGWKRAQASLKHALRRVMEEPQSLIRGVGTAAVAILGAGLAKRWVEGRMEGGGGEEDEWEWVEMTPWEEMVDRIQSLLPGRGGGKM